MKAAALLAVALATLAAGTPARAQKPAGAGGSAETTKLDEAQRRFQRGIELYKEGDFGGALVEFKRAYDLVPSYKILYNLGQVSYQRHDYASAVRYFRQYLGEADDAISPERQKEVATEINRLSPRVGSLEIQAFDDGAEVFVDDVLMGTTPAESADRQRRPAEGRPGRAQRRARDPHGRRRGRRGRARVVSASRAAAAAAGRARAGEPASPRVAPPTSS